MTTAFDRDILTTLQTARLFASRSRAIRLRVGASIFHVPTRNIISSGFNGTRQGQSNTMEDLTRNVTLPDVIHAEINAINKIPWWLRWVFRSSVMVVTHAPCLSCAKRIVWYKFAGVYFETPYRCERGVELLHKHSIPVKRLYANKI
jgi:dCMP deaminase